VYDWDQFSQDDPMGRFSVPLVDALDMNPGFFDIKPRWFVCNLVLTPLVTMNALGMEYWHLLSRELCSMLLSPV
jgi:hypothetical protein